MKENNPTAWQGSTILSVRKGKEVLIAADGQVTLGNLILKSNVRKVRRLGKGDVIAGFAGSTADAVILFERLESKLEQNPHQLIRSCVDLAKEWSRDPFLQYLDAMAVVNASHSLIVTSTGDVLESEDGLIGIGTGGSYALAAAHALLDVEGFTPEMIAEKAMNIAAEMCVFTNTNIAIEKIEG